MKRETVGVVRNGRIQLPPDVVLPEGTAVRVVWEEAAGDLPDQPDEASSTDPGAAGIARAVMSAREPLA